MTMNERNKARPVGNLTRTGPRRGYWFATIMLSVLLLAQTLPDLAVSETTPEVAMPTAPSELASLWGIEITTVALTAAGSMIDIRYRVLDPYLAADLLQQNQKVTLVDDATGWTLSVPRFSKVGPMRQTDLEPAPGRIYFLFFSNPGKCVQSGQTVSLQLEGKTVATLIVH